MNGIIIRTLGFCLILLGIYFFLVATNDWLSDLVPDSPGSVIAPSLLGGVCLFVGMIFVLRREK